MENLISKLEENGFIIDYEPGYYLNVARSDGLHCEFYPFGDIEDFGLSATYTIDGIETEIDEVLDSSGIKIMVEYIKKILNKSEVKDESN
jgi:hypothetical protein